MPEKIPESSPSVSIDKTLIPTANISSSQKMSLSPLMIVVLICILAVSIVGSYLVFKQSQQVSLKNPVAKIEPNLVSPTSEPTSVLPTGIAQNSGSEIVNQEMKTATHQVSADGKDELWLAGKNFTATQLWINDITTSERILVVETTANLQDAQVGDFSLISPIWSPDGAQIAYLRAVITNIGQFDVEDKLDLYIVNRDGSDDHLVQSDLKIARGKYGETDMAWTDAGITYSDVSLSVEGKKATIKPI